MNTFFFLSALIFSEAEKKISGKLTCHRAPAHPTPRHGTLHR